MIRGGGHKPTPYLSYLSSALVVAAARARATSVRQRVELCRLPSCERHFVVMPVDAPPALQATA